MICAQTHVCILEDLKLERSLLTECMSILSVARIE
jgi:hypothetical protein